MLNETADAIRALGPDMVAYAIRRCDALADFALRRNGDLTALRALELRVALQAAPASTGDNKQPAV